MNNTLMPRKD